MTRLRNLRLTTVYFHDPEEAGRFAIRMRTDDVTHVRGNFPWAVTFDVRQF